MKLDLIFFLEWRVFIKKLMLYVCICCRVMKIIVKLKFLQHILDAEEGSQFTRDMFLEISNGSKIFPIIKTFVFANIKQI